jgi:hypothetical protein
MLHHDYAHIYIHNFIKLRNMILNLTFKNGRIKEARRKKMLSEKFIGARNSIWAGQGRRLQCVVYMCLLPATRFRFRSKKKCNKVQTSASASHSHAAASSSAAP